MYQHIYIYDDDKTMVAFGRVFHIEPFGTFPDISFQFFDRYPLIMKPIIQYNKNTEQKLYILMR